MPNLKKIRSEICLGRYAEHFLREPSLVDVDLYCFSLLTTPGQWQTIRDFWPQLEYFGFNHGEGLTQTVVWDVFSRFHELKHLVLPQSVFFGKKYYLDFEIDFYIRLSFTNFKSSLALLGIQLRFPKDPFDPKDPFAEDFHNKLPSCRVCKPRSD